LKAWGKQVEGRTGWDARVGVLGMGIWVVDASTWAHGRGAGRVVLVPMNSWARTHRSGGLRGVMGLAGWAVALHGLWMRGMHERILGRVHKRARAGTSMRGLNAWAELPRGQYAWIKVRPRWCLRERWA
jgi:hypothetical protein